MFKEIKNSVKFVCNLPYAVVGLFARDQLDYKKDFVTCKINESEVVLTGSGKPKKDIKINIYTANKKLELVPKVNVGNNPIVELFTMDKSGYKFIFYNVELPAGGSYSAVYSAKEGIVKTLFESDIFANSTMPTATGVSIATSDAESTNLATDSISAPVTLTFPYYNPYKQRFGLQVYINCDTSTQEENTLVSYRLNYKNNIFHITFSDKK